MVTNGNHITNGDMSQNKKLFLEKYPEYGTIGATIKAIGLKRRTTFYTWCEKDPAFKAHYESELLPNRRDEVASIVYRAATGREKIATATQLTAAFGFLKATDHNDDASAKDRLVFCEKNQVEIAGAGGKPIELVVRWDGNRNETNSTSAATSS